jgi:hypothetical protein
LVGIIGHFEEFCRIPVAWADSHPIYHGATECRLIQYQNIEKIEGIGNHNIVNQGFDSSVNTIDVLYYIYKFSLLICEFVIPQLY